MQNNKPDKIIYDYKQGLGQLTFHTFELLSKYYSQEVSKNLVIEEIDRVRNQFGDTLLTQSSFLDELIESKNKEMLKANETGDFVSVMELEDEIRAINRTIQLLNNKETKN